MFCYEVKIMLLQCTCRIKGLYRRYKNPTDSKDQRQLLAHQLLQELHTHMMAEEQVGGGRRWGHLYVMDDVFLILGTFRHRRDLNTHAEEQVGWFVRVVSFPSLVGVEF